MRYSLFLLLLCSTLPFAAKRKPITLPTIEALDTVLDTVYGGTFIRLSTTATYSRHFPYFEETSGKIVIKGPLRLSVDDYLVSLGYQKFKYLMWFEGKHMVIIKVKFK
jgi:hypothetical protein